MYVFKYAFFDINWICTTTKTFSSCVGSISCKFSPMLTSCILGAEGNLYVNDVNTTLDIKGNWRATNNDQANHKGITPRKDTYYSSDFRCNKGAGRNIRRQKLNSKKSDLGR